MNTYAFTDDHTGATFTGDINDAEDTGRPVRRHALPQHHRGRRARPDHRVTNPWPHTPTAKPIRGEAVMNTGTHIIITDNDRGKLGMDDMDNDSAPAPVGADPMTPGEFRSVIDYLGLSQDDAARVLDVTTRTVRHWIAGKHPVPDGVREALERAEAATGQAVGDLVDALNDARDPAILVYRTDEGMWEARPESRPWPARWWRHVVMRACVEVPGVAVENAEDVAK